MKGATCTEIVFDVLNFKGDVLSVLPCCLRWTEVTELVTLELKGTLYCHLLYFTKH